MNIFHVEIKGPHVCFEPISSNGVVDLIDKLSEAHIYKEFKSERGDTTQDSQERDRYRHIAFRRN